MMLVWIARDKARWRGLGTKAYTAQVFTKVLPYFLIGCVSWSALQAGSAADQGLEARIQGLIPEIERYITSGMKSFDVPGLAIGIVANDKLVYGKGFGSRAKEGGATIDTRTVFQIGSATKGFSQRLSR